MNKSKERAVARKFAYKSKKPILVIIREERGEKQKLLSRDCDGCGMQRPCIKRYRRVNVGEKVYCPDGTAHLVDNASLN